MVATSSYHENEDLPDMTDPGTALDMWQSQMQTLSGTLDSAHETVDEAKRKLGGILKHAEEHKLPKLAERALAAYEGVKSLHLTVQRQDAALRGAGAAFEAISEQRDEVLNELAELTAAIDHGDESHPKLRDYAEEIRETEREYAEKYGLEYAFEISGEELYENVAQALVNVGIPHRRARHYASELIDIFNNMGSDFNPVQAEMVRQLCATFPLPDAVIKAEEKDAQTEPLMDEDFDDPDLFDDEGMEDSDDE